MRTLQIHIKSAAVTACLLSFGAAVVVLGFRARNSGINLGRWRERSSSLQQYVGLGHRLTAEEELERKAVRDSKYSIIVSTYTRYEHLLQSLHHYGNGDFPNLDAIFVAWGLGAIDPPSTLDLDSFNVPVYLERARSNSLTERFRLPAKMRTSAALWVDDDILISNHGLEFAFRAWKSFGKTDHRIVGFSGRSHKIEEGMIYYLFDTPGHSMVLTDSAFMDTTMLNWFWRDDARIKAAIRYVDKRMNCEDILMNYIVSMNNHLPPLMISTSGQIKVVRSKSLHDQSDHFYERATCISKFNRLFGDVLSTSDLVIGRSSSDSRQLIDLGDRFAPGGEGGWGRDKAFSNVTTDQADEEEENTFSIHSERT